MSGIEPSEEARQTLLDRGVPLWSRAMVGIITAEATEEPEITGPSADEAQKAALVGQYLVCNYVPMNDEERQRTIDAGFSFTQQWIIATGPLSFAMGEQWYILKDERGNS